MTDGITEEDSFSLSRARQMLALLGHEPNSLRLGDRLPRGWHNAMFAQAVAPDGLGPDGFAGLGVPIPMTDLPRLMFGGRRIRFEGDLAIGQPAHRVSRLAAAEHKQGRSGRLLVLSLQRDIVDGGGTPIVTEQQDYVLREAAAADPAEEARPEVRPQPGGRRFVADETMLFRYNALTFNTHRIHYDHPYATGVEGYPALVVNGNLTALMLSELFRAEAGREPVSMMTRNLRPLFCNHENRLHATPGDPAWELWAEDQAGRRALRASIT